MNIYDTRGTLVELLANTARDMSHTVSLTPSGTLVELLANSARDMTHVSYSIDYKRHVG